MHMTYPVLPRQPPGSSVQRLNTHHGSAFQDLADMMHYGLSHFVGKGLPTIWCSINTDLAPDTPVLESDFSAHDSNVIRLWARKLDDWLVRYNGTSRKFPQQSSANVRRELCALTTPKNRVPRIGRGFSFCSNTTYTNSMCFLYTIRPVGLT